MKKTYKTDKYEIKIEHLLQLLGTHYFSVEKMDITLSDHYVGLRNIDVYRGDKFRFWFKKPVTIIADEDLEQF